MPEVLKYNSKLFDYDKERKQFVTEASTLGNPTFSKLYDDVCDIGFLLESARTGVVVPYKVVQEKRDREDDIEYWKLVPTQEAIRRIPGAEATSIIVFND
jgi:hypothetical protein